MRFGISTFITDEGIGPAELGKAVEDRGFDSLFIAEHTHIPVSRESPYPGGGDLPRIYYRTLDPFVALTAAAVVTENILLGTGIALVTERDPIVTAKEVASLDLLSGGRAAFGVGVGWNREEMRNHGTDPRTRGALTNERLRAMKALWTQEQAEYHGRYVDFDPVYAWPKPVQSPHPPIYVGGNSPGALDRLVELGDAWMPNAARAEDLAEQIVRVRDRAGRDVPVTTYATRRKPEVIEAYAKLGIDRILLYLPTLPREESLARLDELTETVRRFA